MCLGDMQIVIGKSEGSTSFGISKSRLKITCKRILIEQDIRTGLIWLGNLWRVLRNTKLIFELYKRHDLLIERAVVVCSRKTVLRDVQKLLATTLLVIYVCGFSVFISTIQVPNPGRSVSNVWTV
jgi:hypothetical protein